MHRWIYYFIQLYYSCQDKYIKSDCVKNPFKAYVSVGFQLSHILE